MLFHKSFFKWFFLYLLVGVSTGLASVFFLKTLDWVTHFRETHLWIIAFLPAAGFLTGLVYQSMGKKVEAGHHLILDEIHDPKKVISFRMAPLILISTLATHLFGGSAGREGTAVQMGGAIADQFSKPFHIQVKDRSMILMAGISAGFASVFGTPLAGAVFGLEVLVLKKFKYSAILPCFFAAIISHETATALGVRHQMYSVSYIPKLSAFFTLQTMIAGVVFGIAGMIFAKTTRVITRVTKKYFPQERFRVFAGGIILVLMILAADGSRYVGLGIPVISEAFTMILSPFDFIGKFIFTAVTLGFGFKGGEVTPLFYIGATLGNALSHLLTLPAPLLAALGFVAVFAGAANTPVTCVLMAVEIFGPDIGVYAVVACLFSYFFSGHTGIYHSQEKKIRKI